MPTVFVVNPVEKRAGKPRKQAKKPTKKGSKMAKGTAAERKAHMAWVRSFQKKGRGAGKTTTTTGKKSRKRAVSSSGTVKRVSSSRRSFRSNPVGGMMNNAMDVLKGALAGAGGSLAVSAIWARLPVPDQVKTGVGANLGRAIVGAGAALMLRKVLGPKLANSIATGVVTVELTKAASDLAAKQGLNLGFWEPGQTINPNGEFVKDETTGEVLWQDATGAVYRLPDSNTVGEFINYTGVNNLGEFVQVQ